MSSNALAEVLSFSIVHEEFQLHKTNAASGTPRVDRLRKSFFISPIKESELQVSSKFGMRRHPVLKKQKTHDGVDYTAPKGTPIQATADGTVAFIGRQNGYGKVVIIEHTANLSTVYAHQSRFASGLKKGDSVVRGDTIGYVGSTGMVTGNHLHYEVRMDDQPINPLKVDRLFVENEYFSGNIN
ncbi:M23 family metallopeptidase [Paracandidimonas lactea]|uniref:M23 family metallopeptidase n=1 Tax=Paracandidimonas lactea TaxID=2895524 RepID=UPI001F392F41|nr:M23 family metallopeptidase [Paracandidimonas lactea]